MRSKLFVPAARPELFEKALTSEADAISFDLEDAVDASRKEHARRDLVAHLAGRARDHGKLLIVRVNAADTPHIGEDLRAAVQARLDVVNLPKLEDADTVRAVADELERLESETGAERPLGLLLNVETPLGLRAAPALAAAHPRIIGLQIGFGDLFSILGIPQDEEAAKHHVRFAVRCAAAEAGLPVFDGAFVQIDDPDGFVADARAAQRLGFAGKSCIHPSQIGLANTIFRPSDREIAHALRVTQAAAEAAARGVGAFVVDGRLVDGPFITRAAHTVSIARRLGILEL